MRLPYLLLVLATIFFMDASSEDSQELTIGSLTAEKMELNESPRTFDLNLITRHLTSYYNNLLRNAKEWLNQALKTINLSLTPQTAVDLVMQQNDYKIQTHTVNVNVSKLNYTLELHRIRDKSIAWNVKKPVAFVMHGILCSSICWIIPGPGKGLAYVLAKAGYDVWLGNTRGNTYSHKIVDPDDTYWDFSFHEIGVYDLPAMIDYIVQATGYEKMFYLGHSQGTTAFFVMSVERPEYQDKIQAMFAMAPVAFCGRIKSPIFQFLASIIGPINNQLKSWGLYKFPFDHRKYLQWICLSPQGNLENKLMPLCSKVMLFLLAGFSKDQIEPKLLSSILEHFPVDISIKQLVHYAQLVNSGNFFTAGKFREFASSDIDFPPEYNLTKIEVPVSLHYATNDWLANTEDVAELERNLGAPFGSFRVLDRNFNHLDFMWAKDVNELLYNKILCLMTLFQNCRI